MVSSAGSLCDVAEVKLIAQISANSDITDGEIASAIDDVSYWMRSKYGDPVRRTYTFIEYGSSGSTYYDFTGNNEPVYKITEIQSDNASIPTGSYTGSLDVGFVDFNTTFLSDDDGNRLDFEWVPKIYNLLAKNLAALEILKNTSIIDGRSVEKHLLHQKIKEGVLEYSDTIRPQGVFRSTAYKYDNQQQPGDYVDQTHWFT